MRRSPAAASSRPSIALLLVGVAPLFLLGSAGCSSCGRPASPPSTSGSAAAPAPPAAPAGGDPTAGAPAARSDQQGEVGAPGLAATDGGTAREAAERAEKERAARATCSAYVASLGGGPALDRTQRAAVDGVLPRVEQPAVPLAECLAVEKHSDAPCDALNGMKPRCLVRAAFAREAGEPGKHRDEVAAALFSLCTAMTPHADCAAVRDAARSTDGAGCPASNDEGATLCAAYVWRDRGRCPSGDKKLAAVCAGESRWTSLLAKGGRAQLAADGDEADRALMDALAGRSGACAGAEKRFLDACVAALTPPPKDPTHHKLTGP